MEAKIPPIPSPASIEIGVSGIYVPLLNTEDFPHVNFSLDVKSSLIVNPLYKPNVKKTKKIVAKIDNEIKELSTIDLWLEMPVKKTINTVEVIEIRTPINMALPFQ